MRDGIDWERVAKAIGTRDAKQCHDKWYNTMRPSMTENGEWDKSEDMVLLHALWAARPEYVRCCVVLRCWSGLRSACRCLLREESSGPEHICTLHARRRSRNCAQQLVLLSVVECTSTACTAQRGN